MNLLVNEIDEIVNKIKYLKLADQIFDSSRKIDLIISADLYGQAITGSKIVW